MCGEVCEAENFEMLAQIFCEFNKNNNYSMNAITYYNECFDKTIFFDKLNNIFSIEKDVR